MGPHGGIWGDAGYYALLLGGLVSFFWLKHRFERALQARTRGRAFGARPLMEGLRNLAEPAFLAVPARGASFSKLGGRPDLPVGSAWPMGAAGPMRFLGQIELSEARTAQAIEWLPERGALYVFCEAVLHDGREFVRVLYVRDANVATLSMVGASAPERHIDLLPVRSLPSSCWLAVDDDFSAAVEASAEHHERLPKLQAPRHQLGGYPDEIQKEQMAISCQRLAGPGDWRLLLQLDTDGALKMEFGDGGRLFVFVRETDAKAGDFTRTVTIWQTY
jgi:hypothetical protein